MSGQAEAAPTAGLPFVAVGSEPRADGSGEYECVLFFNSERVRSLDAETAAAYTAELARVITCAEHDAAILAQCADIKAFTPPMVGAVLRGVRAARRPTLAAATHPMEFSPIVSARDHQPRVAVRWGDVTFIWEAEDAWQHLAQVMRVVGGVDLDGVYRRFLRDEVGLNDETAAGMVMMLRGFMSGMMDMPTPPS